MKSLKNKFICLYVCVFFATLSYTSVSHADLTIDQVQTKFKIMYNKNISGKFGHSDTIVNQFLAVLAGAGIPLVDAKNCEHIQEYFPTMPSSTYLFKDPSNPENLLTKYCLSRQHISTIVNITGL